MQVVISVPPQSPWAGWKAPEGYPVLIHNRPWAFRVSRWRRPRRVLTQAWDVFRSSRGADTLVVCNGGTDFVAIAVLLWFRPRQKLVGYDVLLPKSPLVGLAARWVLRRVHLWLVVRRGDEQTFRDRLGARSCRFVPYPGYLGVPSYLDSGHDAEPFVYAAGSAYRDWPTLVRAAVEAGVRVTISTPDQVELPPDAADLVTVLPMLSPAAGRELAVRSALVCQPMLDTHLASGPTVILDAMSLGRAVLVSDVNGSRDYVQDGVTAVVVPPGDVPALRDALVRLLADPQECRRLAVAAQASVPRAADVLAELIAQVV